MRNLYDVFTAIRADEGDHVSAMKACLDPNVALVSPSIERRLLTAAALVSSVGAWVATGGGSPTEMGVDGVEGLGSIADKVETAAAGIAAVAGQVLGNGASADTVEGVESAAGSTEAITAGLAGENWFTGILGGITGFFGASKFMGGQDAKTKTAQDSNSTLVTADEVEPEIADDANKTLVTADPIEAAVEEDPDDPISE